MTGTVNVIKKRNEEAMKVALQEVLDNNGQILYVYFKQSPSQINYHVAWVIEGDEPEA